MQTHEELLEDIRDDTTGVNIIPDKGKKLCKKIYAFVFPYFLHIYI